MSSQINELVRMRDVDSLYEIMTEDDEWLNQLDAAEGLLKLGDRRGYEFILSAMMSEDDGMRAIRAQEAAMQLIRGAPVLGEATLTGQQTRVFEPRDAHSGDVERWRVHSVVCGQTWRGARNSAQIQLMARSLAAPLEFASSCRAGKAAGRIPPRCRAVSAGYGFA